MMELTFSTPLYILPLISRQHGHRITSVGHFERPRDLVEHVESKLKLKTEIYNNETKELLNLLFLDKRLPSCVCFCDTRGKQNTAVTSVFASNDK